MDSKMAQMVWWKNLGFWWYWMAELERDIERYLIRRVERAGGVCWKWTGKVGVPDRVVVMSGRRIRFVEVKGPKGKLSPYQEHVHRQLRDRGVEVDVVWCRKDVDLLMDDLSGEKIVGVGNG